MAKTPIARLLARSANCQGMTGGEPDNSCDICREMLEGRSLDLMEIDAASHTGVENIREIIEHLNLPPTRAKFRTYIIDEVHMLSRGAFNALLKTLEEPPAHALFILATTEAHKVPATIISRTQRFDFRKLTDEQIGRQLQKIILSEGLDIEKEVASAISESVDGSMRDGLVLLEKAVYLSDKKTSAEDIQRLLGITPVKFRSELLELLQAGDLRKISDFFKNLSAQGYSLEQFTKDFLEFLRNKLSEDMDIQLSLISEHFLRAYQQLRVSPIPELPLLVASVKYIQSKAGGDKSNSGSGQKAVEPSLEKLTVKAAHVLNGHIEMSDLQEKWGDVLGRVREYNQSLVTALKLARPTGTVNGSLTIAFPYKFHADAVNSAKNRLVVERVLEEIFGRRIAVNCVMQKDILADNYPGDYKGKDNGKGKNNDGDNDLLKSALDMLGGEVIN